MPADGRLVVDVHHINFPRREHDLHASTRAIRSMRSLMPTMLQEVHRELHKVCPAVPTLGYYAANTVARNLQDTGNTFSTLDNYFHEIELATKGKNARATEWELGQVVIAALETQIPFLQRGIINRG